MNAAYRIPGCAYGFRLRTIQRLELLVAKIELDIVQIFSDRFLQKQPGGIQHSDKDDLHQKNRPNDTDLGGRKPLQKRIGDDCASLRPSQTDFGLLSENNRRQLLSSSAGEHTAKSRNGITIINW